METKKRDAVLWKQDSFYPVPCFQVRFKRWRDCATLPSPKSANLLSLLTRGLWVGLQGFEQLQTYEQEPSSPVYEWIKHYRVYGQLLLQQDNQWKIDRSQNAKKYSFSAEVKYCGLKWVGEGRGGGVYECITRITGLLSSLTRKLKQRKPSATCTPTFASSSYCANIKKGKLRRKLNKMIKVLQVSSTSVDKDPKVKSMTFLIDLLPEGFREASASKKDTSSMKPWCWMFEFWNNRTFVNYRNFRNDRNCGGPSQRHTQYLQLPKQRFIGAIPHICHGHHGRCPCKKFCQV